MNPIHQVSTSLSPTLLELDAFYFASHKGHAQLLVKCSEFYFLKYLLKKLIYKLPYNFFYRVKYIVDK